MTKGNYFCALQENTPNSLGTTWGYDRILFVLVNYTLMVSVYEFCQWKYIIFWALTEDLIYFCFKLARSMCVFQVLLFENEWDHSFNSQRETGITSCSIRRVPGALSSDPAIQTCEMRRHNNFFFTNLSNAMLARIQSPAPLFCAF